MRRMRVHWARVLVVVLAAAVVVLAKKNAEQAQLIEELTPRRAYVADYELSSGGPVCEVLDPIIDGPRWRIVDNELSSSGSGGRCSITLEPSR